MCLAKAVEISFFFVLDVFYLSNKGNLRQMVSVSIHLTYIF